jgi:hypothetical protein
LGGNWLYSWDSQGHQRWVVNFVNNLSLKVLWVFFEEWIPYCGRYGKRDMERNYSLTLEYMKNNRRRKNIMSNYEKFIQAIHNKRIIVAKIDSKEKGVITRTCIPFDYGPSRIYKDGLDRYHLYDLDSPEGKHNLSVIPEQIIDIEITNEHFEPSDYVRWEPNWIIERDWGIYS